MISYFAAATHARITRFDLGSEWDDVPVFCLGGAGFHYAGSTVSSLHCPRLYTERSDRWRKIQVPLDALPREYQGHYHGDWFDAQDLEAYLEHKGVHIYTPPSNEHPRAKAYMHGFAVNMACLIAGKGLLDLDRTQHI